MSDGSIYVGISLTTGTKMYAMPQDSGIMTWSNAIQFTYELPIQYGFGGSKQATANSIKNAKTDGGWRLPTKTELNQLYENKADIGHLDSNHPWYLSSPEASLNNAYNQSFTDGDQIFGYKSEISSVRCVRSEPQ